ncbi:MAG TPA: LytTR family DNA-binding domain-containing protein [Ottowia sp.]|uniref:LytR/AlgR family response regulator transcription factor n=1 Tax=Ottowia sp. TaxID=1898956 RepID=UPI002B77E24C|nr:LytTR family DNA-binding domain-containing protein [Ottowia sp.]HMN22445.1 LytTR family DNA-binding domain-containing protein [Ottowia sp.]
MSTPPAAHAAPTALVAEDEPVLARTLVRLLRQAWPELRIVAQAEDGLAATALALDHLPAVLFLDIRMPGRSGLEVAAAVTDDWPEGQPLPLLVFVTAYDEFAVQAFERAAVDYVLKPVAPERLAQTAARLRQRLSERAAAAPGDAARLLRTVQAIERADGPASLPPPATERIRVLRAAVGSSVRMIALADVIVFEATDKYVNVVTESGDALIRMSLRELAMRLEGVEFVQVHRSMLVNAARIRSATRDEIGHYWLELEGLKRPVKASRAFGHLFKPM